MRLRCPECGSKSFTRTTRKLSQTMIEGYFDCKNTQCGCRFKTITEIVGVLIEGRNNPLIKLKPIRRKLKKYTDLT